MKTEFIYGRRPVLVALRAGRRSLRRAVVAQGTEESGMMRVIREAAEQRKIRVESAPRDRLDRQAPASNHQGVLLEAGPYPYAGVEDILAHAASLGEPPFLLLLDLLQDVQNVGTLLRTAEAVGVHGVILQERRAVGITPAVVSASSGAVEHLLIAQVTNLVRTMEILKKADVWLMGLDMGNGAVRYDMADLRGALGVVVGSEGQGLRRLVRETCDFIVYLPMRGSVESLNAATAGSVVLYAAWQARGFAGESGGA